MQNLLVTLNLLLAQTAQEKRLTILYVSLFAFLLVLLLIDSREGKKWVGGNKLLYQILIVAVVLVVVALVVLYFVLK